MTRRQTWRTLLTVLTLAASTALLAVLWHNWGDLLGTAPVADAPPVNPELLQRGELLARAGNCLACHTARGGEPGAGGRPIDTPFGVVYSSNLTPEPDTGLGAWRAVDFWRALHWGRSRDGRLLNPAFPYEHTSRISRADSDALYLWLRTLAPVRQSPPPHQLPWPLGSQAALAVWRTLFFEPQAPIAQAEPTEAYQRGAYWVEGVGHCAACHAPRNALGAGAGVRVLTGAPMPGGAWYAPSLVDDAQTALASTPLNDVVRLLQTGHSAHASTAGPMAEVVQQGLQHLPEQALWDMATYLRERTLQTPAPTPRTAAPAAKASWAELGRQVYTQHCADCHGAQGQGVPGLYPALSGRPAVALSDSRNLVQTVLHGGYGVATQGHPRPFGMPPYLLTLSDAEIAAVLTHVRQGLPQPGPRLSEVTPLQVLRLRTQQTGR